MFQDKEPLIQLLIFFLPPHNNKSLIIELVTRLIYLPLLF